MQNQVNEMSKESRFKERFEDDLHRVKKEVGAKDTQIMILNDQLTESQVKAQQLQNTIKEMRVSEVTLAK